MHANNKAEKSLNNEAKKEVFIGIVDDHEMFREGLVSLLCSSETIISNKYSFTVSLQAKNGVDLIEKLKNNQPPSIILLDINMPEMDGFKTAAWLRENFPKVKIIVVSMDESADVISRMLSLGVAGYVGKQTSSTELFEALYFVINGLEFVYKEGAEMIKNPQNAVLKSSKQLALLVDYKERELLKWMASELTYKEISKKIFIGVRTIDSYRETLCKKLGVKSRTGLVLFAIKHGILTIDGELTSQ